MFVDGYWMLRTLELGAGKFKQYLNVCISTDCLIINNGLSNLTVKYLEGDYKLNIYKEDTMVAKVEQKEREVEDNQKGSDPKAKDAKAKDPKAAKGKGAEVEKKKEIYFTPVLHKTGDAMVTAIAHSNYNIKLWSNGDIQVFNANIDGHRVYKNDASIVKIEGDTKTTFQSTGEYSVYKQYNKETSKIPFYETVFVSGERKITPLISPPEDPNPDASPEEPKEEEKTLEPYTLNLETDAYTGSECITRDDNTLTVR